jgi:hypothetical protein
VNIAHYVPRCVRCHKRFDCALLLEERGTLGTAPRCRKPVRQQNGAPRTGDSVPRSCGRPEGHSGWCQSAESYRRKLEAGRIGAREKSANAGATVPKPRCGKQLRARNGQADVCGRPADHSGRHLGVKAYRRVLDRNNGRPVKPRTEAAA